MNLYEKYVCTKRTGQMDKKLIAKIAGWELSSSEPESWPFRWVSQGFTGLTFAGLVIVATLGGFRCRQECSYCK